MPVVRLLMILALLAAGTAGAAPTTSNLEREKNWAEQIVDSVVVGEPVWLTNRGHKFLALYAPPATGKSPVAVILMHGRGVHPAWGFIDRLRSDIADAGYHTLSVQMPILTSEAKFASYAPTFPEAFERIDAGIRYLRQRKGVSRVVLLGHSSGGMTAIAYASKYPQAPLAGVIGIGLSTLPNGPDIMQPARMLKTIRIPVLDIYGANDLHEVVTYAAARRTSAEQIGNKDYTAVRTPGADHFFTDQYDALVRGIVDWLARYKGR